MANGNNNKTDEKIQEQVEQQTQQTEQQTSIIEKTKNLLKSYNEEGNRIKDVLQEYKQSIEDTDDISSSELLEQLESIKSNTKTTTHFDALEDSISSVKEILQGHDTISAEDYKELLDEISSDIISSTTSNLQDIGSNITSLITQNEALNRGFSQLSSSFGQLLSPFQDFIDVGMGAFNVLRGGMSTLFQLPSMLNFSSIRGAFSSGMQSVRDSIRNLRESFHRDNEKQLRTMKENEDTLTNMYDLDKDQYRWRLRQTGAGASGMMGRFGEMLTGFAGSIGTALKSALMGSVLALAATLGGVFRSFTLPFEVIGKTVNKLTPIARWFSSIVDSVIGVLSKVPGGTKILGYFQKMFQWIQTFTSTLNKASGLLGTMVKGLKLGFRVLGWPITIIFGLIDFIRGFTEEQGTVLEKMKAGVSEAFKGFFELPIKLIGWLSDWVLSWFNINIEGGTAQKIFSGLEFIINKAIGFVSWPFKQIGNVIQSFLNTTSFDFSLGGIITGISALVDRAVGFIISPFDTIKNLLQGTKNLFSDMIPSWESVKNQLSEIADFDLGSKIANWLHELWIDIKNWLKGIIPSWSDVKEMIPGTELISDASGAVSSAWNWTKGFFSGEDKDQSAGLIGVGRTGIFSRDRGESQENFPSRQEGGSIPQTGLYRLHRGEYVIPPADTGARQTGNQENILNKIYQSNREIVTAVANLGRSTERAETQQPQFPSSEIPDEIENISLLIFNKNWGIL